MRTGVGVATVSSMMTLTFVASTGAATVTASSLLASATRDAIAATSVHEVGVTTQSSTSSTEQENNDVGTNGGIQQFAFSSGALADVIALDAKKKLYIRGNADALTNFFGLDLVDPNTYAGEWLLVTPKDPNYRAVALATTLRSDFDLSLDFKGHLTLGPATTVDGQRVRAISGTVPAQEGSPSYSATVYVTVGVRPFPVALHATVSGATYKETWSRWGEKLKLTAPKGAILEPITTSAA